MLRCAQPLILYPECGFRVEDYRLSIAKWTLLTKIQRVTSQKIVICSYCCENLISFNVWK
jgi:hypothetical protein